MPNDEKICFFITPIGEQGSEIRKRTDQVQKYIVDEVAQKFGYTVKRADKISAPGIISSQIINLLIEADLVVADLSFHNPNVFYELAIRHAIRKPIIHLIREADSIPFDIVQQRTIKFDYPDLESVEKCKNSLREQIEAIEKDPTLVESPISQAIDLKGVQKSDKLIDKQIGRLISKVEELNYRMNELSTYQPLNIPNGVMGMPSISIGTLSGASRRTPIDLSMHGSQEERTLAVIRGTDPLTLQANEVVAKLTGITKK